MMASASGRPSMPARTTDCGVPPTAIQTGSGSWHRARIDAEVVDRRARCLPDQVTCSRFAELEQQVELLGEQLVVVVEVVAEQRERLDERAAPGHDLGAAAGEQVERRELLEDPHRIVRGQTR